MSSLTKDDVLHVAKLSNLKLTDEEIKKFTFQLAKVVEFVGQLAHVDTSNVEPIYQTTGLKNVLREDSVKQDAILSKDSALSQSKNKVNAMFMVPAILEGRTDK